MVTEAKKDTYVIDPARISRIDDQIIAAIRDNTGEAVFRVNLDGLAFCLPGNRTVGEMGIIFAAKNGDRSSLSRLRSLGETLVERYVTIHTKDDLVLGVAVKKTEGGKGFEYSNREIGVWERIK